MTPIIRLENVHYSYPSDRDEPIQALRGVNLTIYEGEYLVILGHNGSGKSTLAKLLNALFLPTQGEVWVKQWNTKDETLMLEIRSTVGMVFQTPDNQIVATIVEEDVAFGPENLGLPHAEIVKRVDASLRQVDMLDLRHRPPHMLSGGQKQRVCIAGMLAMQPEVLVLDEATAMLDPLGRQEVLETVQRLNKEQGVTIVGITHHMEEAVYADRLIVMEAGEIVLEGTPRELFAQLERLQMLHIDVPQITQLAAALHQHYPNFPLDILSVTEFVEAAQQHLPSKPTPPTPPLNNNNNNVETAPKGAALIELDNITYYYLHKTPLQVKAVDAASLTVHDGEILGIIGHTGSGKSTIMQHLNALLRPHAGRVVIFGQDVNRPKLDVKAIRRRVGLVFQQPEAQLFEQYVGDDVAYGPRNLKLSREEVRERVRRAMETVGLGFEAFKDRLTFALSGGQMRRVALAGVLALEPEVLALDEPTSGLDPQGRKQLLGQILRLNHDHGLTLILVSHNMEELAQVCDRICVVGHGTVQATGPTAHIFSQPQLLRQLGLDLPPVTEAIVRLQQQNIIPQVGTALSVAQALTLILEAFGEPV